MDRREKYWINLFIKKCTILNETQKQIDDFIDFCDKTYTISKDSLKNIKKKYTTNDYINRIIPVIGKYFTVEELKETIKFYSTEAGKKLLNYKFLEDIGKVGTTINMDIEKDFATEYKNSLDIK